MSWLWENCSGKLYNDAGELIAIGYAGGDKGAVPDAVNNPAFEASEGVGPLPSGTYTINPPRDGGHLGPYVLDLTPDASNVMYGRSLFRIHGDNPKMNKSASDGCIILPRTIRQEIWDSGDRTLEVVSKLQEEGTTV